MERNDGQPRASEADLLKALDDGTLSLGDFMNVCDTVVRRSVAEARGFNHRTVTQAAKRMWKRWRQFTEAWNRTLTMAREFADGGLEEPEVEYFDPAGPEDPCA